MNSKIKIAILYASFGGGHKSTANSIKAVVEKNNNVEVQILDYFEYFNKLINTISVNFYNNLINMPENVYKIMYESSGNGKYFSHFLSDLFKLTGIKLIKYFKKFTPDIVICTHPFATIACSYLKKKDKFNFVLANILTDFEIHNLWFNSHKYIDYFFVSSDEMKKDLIANDVSSKKIHITGIPIREGFSKEYDKSHIYEKLKLNPANPTVTFFMGGGQGIAPKEIYDYINIVCEKLSNFNIILISGKNEKIYSKTKEILEDIQNPNIHLYSYLENIPEIMFISKFIISKPGGLTTSEALASGTPMLIILPIPGQEIANIKYLEKHKAGIYLEDLNKTKSILEEINSNPDLLNEYAINAKKISHPHASNEIVEIILKNYKNKKAKDIY